jgi:hypothetical protein
MNRFEFVVDTYTPQGAFGPVGFFPDEELFIDSGTGIVIKDEDSFMFKENKQYKITIEEIPVDETIKDEYKVIYTNGKEVFERIFKSYEIMDLKHLNEIADSKLLQGFYVNKILLNN